jgi:hypothetical protein
MKKIAFIVISIFVIGFVLGLYFNPAVAARIKTQLFGGDPDLPNIAKNKEIGEETEEQIIDKEEYLMSRAENISLYRGIEKDKPFDPQLRINGIKEMERQEEFARSFAPQAAWTEIGPNPIPNGQVVSGAALAVSGRTIAIAVHPTNANIVYVGTANGGLYRTTDGGATWTPLMDSAQSLAIGAIAIAPSSPDTVYVGTGEQSFSADSYYGVGIYRITNASTASPILSGPLRPPPAVLPAVQPFPRRHFRYAGFSARPMRRVRLRLLQNLRWRQSEKTLIWLTWQLIRRTATGFWFR